MWTQKDQPLLHDSEQNYFIHDNARFVRDEFMQRLLRNDLLSDSVLTWNKFNSLCVHLR